ncbi:MAG: bifunctional isocitrate dehydrogenase kinase/phosphatase [Gammaproteobacteria bacterium]
MSETPPARSSSTLAKSSEAAPTDEASSRLTRECAAYIYTEFSRYNLYFHAITQRARTRFRQRDRHGTRRDAVQRIEIYGHCVDQAVAHLHDKLKQHSTSLDAWARIRDHYEDVISPYLDAEFTRTFFSSISRRVLDIVGVNPEVEFAASEETQLGKLRQYGGYRTYTNHGSVWKLVNTVLRDYAQLGEFQDLIAASNLVASKINIDCINTGGNFSLQSVDVIKQVFYRDNRAYLVGRIHGSDYMLPLVIALRNTDSGNVVDAVITNEDDVSIIFSFSRSYIHVDLDVVRDAVAFIKSILPRKPVSEIYTLLGRAKQGKTERYRDMFLHLRSSTDRFEDAAFDRGMVMVVFSLPNYPVVFKVIRDKFSYPKTTVRKDVIDAYKLVFKRDRAGRLIDAQEFQHLKFHKNKFDPALLKELLDETENTVRVIGDDVIIDHLYVERKIRPLNQYLREVDHAQAARAVIDYGHALRDLAASNIFPGDLLLKNFGVTRHGRVIFYDYDELCLVTECNFRDMPKALTHEEEMKAGAWFYVGEADVFPEQFPTFLGLDDSLLDVLVEHHSEILTADYWNDLKQRHLAGEVIDILPYAPIRPDLTAHGLTPS